MLAISSKQLNSTFERIVRDKNGVLVRVRFVVVEVNGEFQAQIISAEAIQKKESIICLPVNRENKIIVENITPSFFSVISPYLSLEFLMSQPTRAPSFI